MENSGSDGNGYKLVKKFGIDIIDTHPGIVQLKLDYPYLKRMDGTKVPGSCTLVVDGKSIRKEYSDILFTRYGISGPAVLQISSEAIRSLKKAKMYVYLLTFYRLWKKIYCIIFENKF